jgi:hypothetical protein
VLTMLFKDDIVLLVLKKRDNEKRKNELWKLNSRLIYRIWNNQET